jgi:hypothetical protein
LGFPMASIARGLGARYKRDSPIWRGEMDETDGRRTSNVDHVHLDWLPPSCDSSGLSRNTLTKQASSHRRACSLSRHGKGVIEVNRRTLRERKTEIRAVQNQNVRATNVKIIHNT